MSVASSFISKRKRLKNTVVMASMAISFAVIIVSLAVCSGFRHDIREGLSEVSGDIRICPVGSGGSGLGSEVSFSLSEVPLDEISKIEGICGINSAIYLPSVIKRDERFDGMLFKGVDSMSKCGAPSPMCVSVPRTFASKAGIGCGDKLVAYFVRDSKTVVRKFTVESIYDNIIGEDSKSFIMCNISDIRRLLKWDNDRVGSLEIILEDRYKSGNELKNKTDEVGMLLLTNPAMGEGASSLWASSSETMYYDIFDWLALIDSNVSFILLIMILVAGFNMMSGLLIMLFENISTIGTLKALGMKDSHIGKAFRRICSRSIITALVCGNAVAIALCLIQKYSGILKLNSENYFLSRVPISIDPASIILVDALCYFTIMLLLMIPVAFIRRISPSESIRHR